MTAETLNYWLALATLAMQAVGALLLIVYILRSRSAALRDIGDSAARVGLLAGFVFSVLGTLLTLYYSDVLGFEPCPLCWWQRAFLYPQVILFALALWKRDARIAAYSIALSIAGAGVALYQHALQILPAGSLPCPAEGASCAQRIVFEFGYITLPLMAATLFGLLIILMLFVRSRDS